MIPQAFLYAECKILFYDELLDIVQELITVVAVDIALETVGRNDTEDTHKALCIYRISSGDEVYIKSAKACSCHKILNIVYFHQLNFYGCHNHSSILSFFKNLCLPAPIISHLSNIGADSMTVFIWSMS